MRLKLVVASIRSVEVIHWCQTWRQSDTGDDLLQGSQCRWSHSFGGLCARILSDCAVWFHCWELMRSCADFYCVAVSLPQSRARRVSCFSCLGSITVQSYLLLASPLTGGRWCQLPLCPQLWNPRYACVHPCYGFLAMCPGPAHVSDIHASFLQLVVLKDHLSVQPGVFVGLPSCPSWSLCFGLHSCMYHAMLLPKRTAWTQTHSPYLFSSVWIPCSWLIQFGTELNWVRISCQWFMVVISKLLQLRSCCVESGHSYRALN